MEGSRRGAEGLPGRVGDDAGVPAGRARRLLVIYNPAAGRRSARRLRRFLDHLARLGVPVELRATATRGDAEEFARVAASGEFDAVVAAGGDGTINEVVSGLGDADLPLALLPLGTANVLANEIGLPRNPERLALIAATGKARPIWTGEVVTTSGVRRFVMMAGIGFDASVVAGIDPARKRRLGKLAYVAEIVVQLARHRDMRFRVRCAGEEIPVAAAVIAKGRFYAGRFVLAPEARLDAPTLEVVLFLRGGRLAVLRYLVAMALGCVHRLRDVRILRAESVAVTGPPGAPVHADGDIVATLPVTMGVASRPLRLIRPG
ncbi:MAG TPA: YegS/Rv2252/BmrU family lipid kinase [Stellaceae bacterium]|nr:YegS/Rv2252/BmrU family lipid kinase [Stellaceae bacterium]